MTPDPTPGRSARDTRESRQAAAEIDRLAGCLAERVAERQAADRELEALSYSISHDLRAPLRAITGFSRILECDYAHALDETGRDYAARIQRSARHMGELIDDLLELLRIGASAPALAEVDLSALAVEISDALRKVSADREVEFDIARGMKARGDAAMLRTALENLLGNAWKFSARRNRARIEFQPIEIGGETTYCIRDNGAGFDMAYAGKLFGAFQRLHDAREHSGNGIGLAIVHRIIARHGGRIWAQAEPENGAAFYFVLPSGGAAAEKSPLLFDRHNGDGASTSASRRGAFCESTRR